MRTRARRLRRSAKCDLSSSGRPLRLMARTRARQIDDRTHHPRRQPETDQQREDRECEYRRDQHGQELPFAELLRADVEAQECPEVRILVDGQLVRPGLAFAADVLDVVDARLVLLPAERYRWRVRPARTICSWIRDIGNCASGDRLSRLKSTKWRSSRSSVVLISWSSSRVRMYTVATANSAVRPSPNSANEMMMRERSLRR